MTVELQHELPLLGVLPQNWRVVEFGDVLYGGTRNGVYKPKEFHGQGDKIVNMGELFANPRLFAIPMKRLQLSDSEQQRFRLEVGDLLFARRSLVASGAGKCSIVCEIDEPTTFESSLIRARPDPHVADSFFLYYLFYSHYGAYILGSILRHVAVAGITGTDLVKLLIPLPPLPEQKAIAHILGTLDDKIELNRDMNQTLEAMARAIFKSWFVDFDPVRAKMEGRQPAGMDAATAELFPDEFEESALGMIPKGWNILPIVDFCSTFTDGSHYSPKAQEIGNPIATVKDMGEFDFLWNQLKLISDEDYNKLVTNGCKAEKGDILFSKDGTIGRVILFSCDRDLVLLSSIAILRPKPEIPGIYLWVFLRQSSTKEIINGGYVSGSALPRVILKDLKKLPIVKPPNQLLRRFSNIVEPIFLKIMSNELESYSLASIRDTLLPKLLSGEIRVKEADKIAAKTM